MPRFLHLVSKILNRYLQDAKIITANLEPAQAVLFVKGRVLVNNGLEKVFNYVCRNI